MRFRMKDTTAVAGDIPSSMALCLEVHGTYSPVITVPTTVLITGLIIILGHLRGL